jgi:putative hemolysin
MLAEIGILLLLVLANGFFAGAEMAVVAVRKARLAALVDERRRGARAVAALRQAPEQFLATVQIGVTVVGSTAAAFGGATIAARLTPLLAEIPPLTRYAQDLAIGVVVALVSFLSLVLGELVRSRSRFARRSQSRSRWGALCGRSRCSRSRSSGC